MSIARAQRRKFVVDASVLVHFDSKPCFVGIVKARNSKKLPWLPRLRLSGQFEAKIYRNDYLVNATSTTIEFYALLLKNDRYEITIKQVVHEVHS